MRDISLQAGGANEGHSNAVCTPKNSAQHVRKLRRSLEETVCIVHHTLLHPGKQATALDRTSIGSNISWQTKKK